MPPVTDKLKNIISATRSLCQCSEEPGVNYTAFQADMPTRSKGHCHPSFFNAFNASIFPQGLHWPDLTLQLQEVLAKGVWDESIQVYPAPVSCS